MWLSETVGQTPRIRDLGVIRPGLKERLQKARLNLLAPRGEPYAF